MRIAAAFIFLLALAFACVAFGSAQTAQLHCCTNIVATPTPSPTPLAAYIYKPAGYGLSVQTYGATAGVGDPQAQADITNASIDPNSATVLANVSPLNTFTSASQATSEIMNIEVAPLPTPYVIGTSNPTGHVPPVPATTWGGGAGQTIRWNGGTFYIENLCHTGCYGVTDAHANNINPASNYSVQTIGSNWTGTAYTAFAGIYQQLNQSYCSNQVAGIDIPTVAGEPMHNFTTWGDDILDAVNNGTPINHPQGVIVSVSSVASGSAGVNLSTLSTNTVGSCTGACLQFGDKLRLKSSVVCPADPAANAWCVELKKYGWDVNDLGSSPVPRWGLDAQGVDDTDAAIHTFQASLTLQADFDIITRGSVHC